MELDNKGQWIFVSGIWAGVGASTLAFSITFLINTKLQNTYDLYIGLILGIIFILLSFVSAKQTQK